MAAPNVAFIRPELRRLMSQYTLIRDCLAGETAVKEQRTLYLPMPDPTDKSAENVERYKAYLMRAVFYNVARTTLRGLMGQIFLREPVVNVPDGLKFVMENATGAGVTFKQVSAKAAMMALAYSRCGMLVDYPDVGTAASVEDLKTGKVRPTVNVYSPKEIVNWRIIADGAEEKLSLVVLMETYPFDDDGFELKHAAQFRVLRLTEQGTYQQEVWRERKARVYDEAKGVGRGNWQMAEIYSPLDAAGEPLTSIPFMFIGSENNDSAPDHPVFYDICSLNMAHYRNSADYEEALFIAGQPTLVVNGLNDEWVDKHLKGKFRMGSRGAIPLPKDSKAELIQAEANTMMKEAMDDKATQMVALGARLVELKTVQKTATEAKQDAATATSTLGQVSANVSQACKWALKVCCQFLGIAVPDDLQYELNKDFDMSKLSAEERKQIVAEWKDGAISFKEMRNGLRSAGSATEDDDEVKAEIEADQKKDLQMQMAVSPNQPGAGAFGER